MDISELQVALFSFGFKHGVPQGIDITVDCRVLVNPYWRPELRHLSGLDDKVREYLLNNEDCQEFIRHWYEELDRSLADFLAQGRTRVRIGIGCTGGRHRSVAIAAETARHLQEAGCSVELHHRDIELKDASPGIHDIRFTPQPLPVHADDLATPLTGKRAVVIGGGTGAPVSIGALLTLGAETSAVVAMADDGGSTGLIRERAGAIPPGDIRRCIVAMAHDPNGAFPTAFNYRLDYAEDHALGNLILTALADVTHSFPEAIRICEELFESRGHVYPSTLDDIVLHGLTVTGERIDGQAHIAHSDEACKMVWLEPESPRPYRQALHALESADYVILGPGSLFTSIIPNLLVPGVVDAIWRSHAHVVFVCGIGDMQGETSGLNCLDYVEALENHGMKGLIDTAIIHQGSPAEEAIAPDARVREGDIVKHVQASPEQLEALSARVGTVYARDLVDPRNPTWHDPIKLRDVFLEAFSR